MDPRPRVGGVRHARFVAHIDDPQTAARGGGEHFVEVIANQREDGIDPQRAAACTNNSAPFGIEPPCYYNRVDTQ